MIYGFRGKWDYQIIECIQENGPMTTYDIGVKIGAIDPKSNKKFASGPIWSVMTRLELNGGVKQIGRDFSKKKNPIVWDVSSNFGCDEPGQEINDMFVSPLPRNTKPCYPSRGVTVHVFDHGKRECNCGGKKVGVRQRLYTDCVNRDKTWHQVVADSD
jgi:hypothetical protein